MDKPSLSIETVTTEIEHINTFIHTSHDQLGVVAGPLAV